PLGLDTDGLSYVEWIFNNLSRAAALSGKSRGGRLGRVGGDVGAGGGERGAVGGLVAWTGGGGQPVAGGGRGGGCEGGGGGWGGGAERARRGPVGGRRAGRGAFRGLTRCAGSRAGHASLSVSWRRGVAGGPGGGVPCPGRRDRAVPSGATRGGRDGASRPR